MLGAAERAGKAVARGGEVGEEIEEIVVGPGPRAGARRLAAALEILLHAQAREDAAIFRHVAEAAPRDAVRWLPQDLLAVVGDAAGADPPHAHDRPDGGRQIGRASCRERVCPEVSISV